MIEYLNSEAFQKYMEENGQEYQKSAETLLRKPTPKETEVTLLRKPTLEESARKKDYVIASNGNVIDKVNGQPIHEEWTIPVEEAIEMFGEKTISSLSDSEFSSHSKQMVSFVNHEGSLRREAGSLIEDGSVIARNEGAIGELDGEPVYNEWVIPAETAVKNYGSDVIDSLSTSEFSAHKKKATIQAVELTSEVMDILEQSGDELAIKVSWSNEPMMAKVGDYLSNQGYSISKTDMGKTYELVNPTDSNNPAFVDKLKESVGEPKRKHETGYNGPS